MRVIEAKTFSGYGALQQIELPKPQPAKGRVLVRVRAAGVTQIGPKVRSGDIRYREDIVDGLERAPEAFIGMLAGRNFGKALVRFS